MKLPCNLFIVTVAKVSVSLCAVFSLVSNKFFKPLNYDINLGLCLCFNVLGVFTSSLSYSS